MPPLHDQFREVADRVWVGRYPWFDVNVTVIGGTDGLAVIDTYSSNQGGKRVLADIRQISPLPVHWAINTHAHFDHVLGNLAFREAGAQLIAHEEAAAAMPDHITTTQSLAATQNDPDDTVRELIASEVVVPERSFSSAMVLDLGGRVIELVHPGRGHTSGDLVVNVPDAGVLVAGDTIEEANDGVPGYGDDCYPADWPTSLDVVLGMTTNSTVVIPGHGAPVDRDFVEEQRNSIAIFAETVRGLAASGASAADALAQGEWPWPRERLAVAVRRAYEQLPPGSRSLPMA